MSTENRRLTVAKPDLLDGESDLRFRDLLYDFFAFGSRLEEARSRFATYIGLTPPQYLILIAIGRGTPEHELGVAQVADRLHLSGAGLPARTAWRSTRTRKMTWSPPS
jgi:hypothetical protein